MKNTVNILHISDTHVNASALLEIDKLVDKLINDVKKVENENNIRIDLICFSGDLINRGDMAVDDECQLKIAEEHLVQPLINALGLTKKEFIIVPGNHEINKKLVVSMTEKGLASINSSSEANETVSKMESEYKNRIQYLFDCACLFK